MKREDLELLKTASIEDLVEGAAQGLRSEDPNVRDSAVRLILHGGARGIPVRLDTFTRIRD